MSVSLTASGCYVLPRGPHATGLRNPCGNVVQPPMSKRVQPNLSRGSHGLTGHNPTLACQPND